MGKPSYARHRSNAGFSWPWHRGAHEFSRNHQQLVALAHEQ